MLAAELLASAVIPTVTAGVGYLKDSLDLKKKRADLNDDVGRMIQSDPGHANDVIFDMVKMNDDLKNGKTPDKDRLERVRSAVGRSSEKLKYIMNGTNKVYHDDTDGTYSSEDADRMIKAITPEEEEEQEEMAPQQEDDEKPLPYKSAEDYGPPLQYSLGYGITDHIASLITPNEHVHLYFYLGRCRGDHF